MQHVHASYFKLMSSGLTVGRVRLGIEKLPGLLRLGNLQLHHPSLAERVGVNLVFGEREGQKVRPNCKRVAVAGGTTTACGQQAGLVKRAHQGALLHEVLINLHHLAAQWRVDVARGLGGVSVPRRKQVSERGNAEEQKR